MATRKIFTDQEFQPSAFLVNPKVHSISDLSQHSGSVGQLVTYSANLYFHDGSNWFTLIESNYSGNLTGAPNFDPSSGSVPFTVGSGHTGRVDNLNADYLDGYDTSTTATSSAIPVYGSGGVLNVGTPTGSTHAATKLYVDNAIQGLDIKPSVAAATTGNIALSGNQTIDGVSITAGMRVLVKDQSTASENGIYVSSASAWALAEDSDSQSLSDGAYVFVENGTTHNNTGWTYVNDGAYTWVQFSGAGQITAGDGLTKTGDTLNAAVASPLSISNDQITIADGAISGVKLDSAIAGDGLAFTTGVLSVNVSAPLSISADTLTIADGAIGGAKLNTAIAGDGLGISAGVLSVNVTGPISIVNDDLTIADGAITGVKLNSAIAGNGIGFGSGVMSVNVTGPITIVNDLVTIQDGALTGAKLANDTVTSTQLANSITVTDLLVQDVSLATLIVGSTGGAGAELILDGAANGDGSGGDFAYIKMTSGDDLHIVNQQTAGTMLFATGSVTRATIAADGKVKLFQNTGIGGDPSSTYTLYAYGDSKIGGTLEATRLGIGSAPDSAITLLVNGSTQNSEYARLGNNSQRHLRLSSFSVSGNANAGHDINASSSYGQITLSTGSSAVLRADQNKRVSIGDFGTANAGSNLHVWADDTVIGSFQRNDSNSGYIVVGNSTTGLFNGSYGGGVLLGVDINERGILWNRSNTDLAIGTNNIERLTIYAGGDIKAHNRLAVGGSVNTNYQLYVVGDSMIDGTLVVDSPTLSTEAATKGYVDTALAGASYDNLDAGDGITIVDTTVSVRVDGPLSFTSDGTSDGTLTIADGAIDGSKLSTNVSGDGLSVTSGILSVNVASPISIVNDQITIADGALTGAKLANNTVTSTQLADDITLSSLDVSGGHINISNDYGVVWGGGTSRPYIIGNKTNGTIVFGEGGSEHMRLTSTGLGLGTTSPGAKLEISGDTRSGGRILYGGTESNYLTGVSYASIYGAADTFESVSGLFGSLVLQSRSNTDRPIIFVTGATPSEKMRLTSDGKLGVGTQNPEEKLVVMGNVGAGNSYNGGFYANANSSNVDTNWGFDFSYSGGTANDYSTRVKYYPVNGQSRKAGIFNEANDSWVLYGDSNTTPNVIVPNGSVAIGTNNAQPFSSLYSGKLVIDTSTSALDGIFSTTNHTNAAELVLTKKNSTNNFGSLVIQHAGTTGNAIAVNYSVNTSSGTGGTNSFKVTTGGEGYFAGSVGINAIPSSSYKLYVNGNSYIDATSANPTLLLGRYSGQPSIQAATDDGGYLIMDSSGTGQGYAALNWYSTDPIALGVGGGNVGVYTTNTGIAKLTVRANGVSYPSNSASSSLSGLTVFGTDGNIDLLSIDDNSTVANSISFGRYVNTNGGNLIHKFGIVHLANTGNVGSNTGDRLSFSYGTNPDPWNNTNLLTIQTDGSVGIGISDPQDKLDVDGTVRVKAPSASDWGLISYDNSGNAASGIWYTSNNAELLLRDSSNNLDIRLHTNGKSYINTDYGFGIGTSDPGSYRLYVSGDSYLSNDVTIGRNINISNGSKSTSIFGYYPLQQLVNTDPLNLGWFYDAAMYREVYIYKYDGSSWTSTLNSDIHHPQRNHAYAGGYTIPNGTQEVVIYYGQAFGYAYLSSMTMMHSTQGNSATVYIETSASGTTNPYDSGWTNRFTGTFASWPGMSLFQFNYYVGGSHDNYIRVRIVPTWNNSNNSISVYRVGFMTSYGGTQAGTPMSFYSDRRVSVNVGLGVGADPGTYKLLVNGLSRLGNTDYGTSQVLSVAPGNIDFDAPNVVGGRLKISSSGYVFNDVGAAVDFRVEGDTDPNLLFLDGSADRVGIGTNLPLQKLHVNGSILLDGVNNGYQQSASRAIGYGGGGGAISVDGFSGMEIQSVNAPSPYNGNYSQNLRFFTHHYAAGTGGSPRMFIRYDGNIGVATQAPTEKLHVNGNIKADNLELGSRLWYTNTVQDTGSGVSNATIIKWKEDTTVLSIYHHYIVQLTTNGTGTDTGACYVVWYDGNNATWEARYVSLAGSSSNHPLLTIAGANNNEMAVYDLHTTSYTVRYTVESHYVGDEDGLRHALGPYYMWQRAGSDLRYDDGNVGIGAAPGSSKLYVNPTGAGSTLTLGRYSGQRSIQAGSDDGGYLIMDSNGGANGGVAALNWYSSDNVILANGGGNVAIGTNSPSGYKLKVNGNSLVTGNTYIGDANRYFQSDSNGRIKHISSYGYFAFGPDNVSWCHMLTDRQGFYFDRKLTTGGNKFESYNSDLYINASSQDSRKILFQSGGASYAVMDATGKWGLGTLTPSYQLHVAGDAYVTGTFYMAGNKALNMGGASQLYYNTTTAGLQFTGSTGNNTVFIKASNGYTGIGTNNPSQKLNVRNGVLLIDTDTPVGSGFWMPDTSGNPSLRIVTDQQDASYTSIINNWGSSANSGVTLGTVRSDGTAFQVRTGVTVSSGYATDSGTTRLVVLGNGNVGVNTPNPSSNLHVAGTAKVTSTLDVSAISVNGTTTANRYLGTNSSGTLEWKTASSNPYITNISMNGFVVSQNKDWVNVNTTLTYNTGATISDSATIVMTTLNCPDDCATGS